MQTLKIRKKIFSISALVMMSATNSSMALDLTETAFHSAGEQYGIDPKLIFSVALAESASSKGSGVTPYPFAIRTLDNAYYPATREAAAAQLSKLQSTGIHSIDVGLMQINLKWHGDIVESHADLLDPETNVMHGTKILSTALASAPGDLELGVGRYHNWADENRSRDYGRRVLNIYQAIKGLTDD